jgi:hypothetical protein
MSNVKKCSESQRLFYTMPNLMNEAWSFPSFVHTFLAILSNQDMSHKGSSLRGLQQLRYKTL